MKKMILMMAFLVPTMFIFAQNAKEVAPAKGAAKETTTQKSNAKEIPVSQLPKAATDYITNNLPGAKITKVTKAENDAEAMYHVAVDLKGKAHSLIFNKEGKFMKMGEEKVTTPTPTVKAPATEQAQPKK
jgi:hypothetical protein